MTSSKMAYREGKQAWLILADGTVFSGFSLGAKGTAIGEVVFTTGMTGYQETLTDPSYYGQIVTQTFPLIGNYGVNTIDRESSGIWLNGYIIREWCYEPSNFRSQSTLGEYLSRYDIVGIYDIDTRALTKKIREYGVMNGAITTEWPDDMDRFLERIRDFRIVDSVKEVSFSTPHYFYCEKPEYDVVLFDYGFNRNISR
ncbi:MAG: carbamoyl-phosphate synthase domain-containing protein, partial [Anaerovoracaceae bacterium]|nr:carbamoyl-phosphate synthase domain-containing protein [Anaerovoracaceae bacterium]